MSVKDRIRRLEHGAASCPECCDKPQAIRVLYPEDDYRPEAESCTRCGRALVIRLEVEYEGGG